MLPMAVVRSSSGVVVIRYVLPVLWMTSFFLYWATTKDRICITLLIYRKAVRIQLPIIKEHNFDYFEITRKLK